ncbi:Sec-independent protein translocase subunit TatA [Corynebacterium timonense]|uniref:Sec-independent protein translocase protein TatA n=1 Tax=Corynebacterium timonense TaxID=441500 RepID=A0A1H1P847_9CORY|nr:Sec-independent protein translocase subunit TatA [Corynebacterium timonense]SDS07333.1 sec-independent protein translocase protein TatA [Corynebacterium timonense]
MPNLGWTEILIILLIILLLFGAAKLPDLARSLGRSARIFKSEVKELKNDDRPVPEQQAELTQGSPETQSASQGAESFWDRPENQPRTQG